MHYLVGRGATIQSLRAAAAADDLEALERFVDQKGRLRPDAGPVRWPFAHTTIPRANDPQEILDQAFVIAVLSRSRAAADRLRELGAQIDATPVGLHWNGTALHGAIANGLADMVEWLIQTGADPRVKDTEHHADAVGWARHFGQVDMADRLARGRVDT